MRRRDASGAHKRASARGRAAVAVASTYLDEKRRRWLGDLDSNQDCPSQSREFYR